MSPSTIARWSLLAVLGFTLVKVSKAADAPRPVAFVHANVVPMDRDAVLRDQTVIVNAGRIQAIGPAASTAIPKNAQVVPATGQYLLPGLADMHVHVYFPEELTLYVVNGVTTIFNLNGQPAHLNWRKLTASGELLGPTIYSVGPTFDHPRTAEESAREVDQQSADGYDGVKIYNQVSAAEYPSLTAEAKKKNLILVGHVAREPGFTATLNAGQSIAHAEEYLYTFFNEHPEPNNDLTHPLDPDKIPQAVAMTKQAGISVIATLVAYHNIVRQLTGLQDFLRNPDLQYLAPIMREQLEPDQNGYAQRITGEKIPHMTTNYEFQKKLVKALHDGGVPILAGTDSAGQGLGVPGFSLIEEIENFQDIGFTPYAALRTATTDAAAMLRQSNEFGTVTVGKRANLLLVRENPLDDVRHLHAIAGVMVHGRWISDSERARLLAQVPVSYRNTTTRLTREAKSNPQSVDRYLKNNDPFGEQSFVILTSLASAGDAKGMRDAVIRLKKADPTSELVSETTINQFAYQLLAEKKSDAALDAFKLNTEIYPRSGNTWDSLAETCLGQGKKDLARQYYEKALEVQPGYANAKAAQEILKTKLQ